MSSDIGTNSAASRERNELLPPQVSLASDGLRRRRF